MADPVTADNFRDILYAPHMGAEERSSLLASKLGGGSMLAYFTFKSQMNAKVDTIRKNMEAPSKLAADMQALISRTADMASPATVMELTQEFSTLKRDLHTAAEKLSDAHTVTDDLANRFLVTAAAERTSSLEDEMKQSHKQKDYLDIARNQFFEVHDHLKKLQSSFEEQAIPLLQARQQYENRIKFNQAAISGFAQGVGHDVVAPEKAAFRPKHHRI